MNTTENFVVMFIPQLGIDHSRSKQIAEFGRCPVQWKINKRVDLSVESPQGIK